VGYRHLEHLISLRLQNRTLAFRVPGKKGKKPGREVAPPQPVGDMAYCDALGYLVRGCQNCLVLFNQQNIGYQLL
jgi:hypothetical protein